MEIIDFSKPTMMYDVLLIVENKKIYCNRAILSIWSNVFEIMFKSNFKEKESSEVYLMGKKKINIRLKESFIKFFFKDKTYDDIHELLRVIYPPNKQITLVNIKRMLELADEYQINELTSRCRQFLLTQRGNILFVCCLLFFLLFFIFSISERYHRYFVTSTAFPVC